MAIMNSKDFHQALIELAQHGIRRMDRQLLAEVAVAVWYSSVQPDLSQIPPLLRSDVGYVLERLARFNILTKQRKLKLLASLEPYRRLRQPAADSHFQDPLAVAWGASADMTPFMQDILPYQTRHYAASH